MVKPREPEHGSMVIYRREVESEQERYRLGVVVGPVLTEPLTGQVWVGVQLPDQLNNPIDLIDVESIIECQPPDVEEPRNVA